MRPIKLNFCNFSNFGDALCPYLIRYLTGREVVPSNVNFADIQAVGSVFYDGGQFFGEKGRFINRNFVKDIYHTVRNSFRKPLVVWGSGFLIEPKIPKLSRCYRNLEIRAVRGEITKQLLRRAGYRFGLDVALGDPGIFYPDLVANISNATKKYDLAIVPNYDDCSYAEILGEKISALGVKVRMIDVLQKDPIQTLWDIASAEKVVASALHAMIVADALGIPNVMISFPNHNTFKTLDYFSSYGMGIPAVLDYTECLHNPDTVLRSIPDVPYVSMDRVMEVKQRLLSSLGSWLSVWVNDVS